MYMYICIYMYTNMFMCVHIFYVIHMVYMYMYLYINIYIYIHVCIYIFIYIHLSMYVYMYIYVHLNMYMITYIHKRGCMVADWARSCSEHCGSGQGVGEIVPSNVTPHKTSHVPAWKMLARGMGGEQALCAWISVKCGMF